MCMYYKNDIKKKKKKKRDGQTIPEDPMASPNFISIGSYFLVLLKNKIHLKIKKPLIYQTHP
jgi:hypothetical protein